MGIGEFLDRPTPRLMSKTSEIAQTLTNLITGAVAAAGLLYLGVTRLHLSRDAYVVAAVALVLLIAVGTGCAFYVRRARRQPDYQIDELRGSLVVRRIDGHQEMVYVREQTVRSRRDRLLLVRMRDGWTGQGHQQPKVRSLYADHALLDANRREHNGRMNRWLQLGEGGLRKGATVDVGLVIEFQDDTDQMDCYYRESGEDASMRSLVLRLCFERDHLPATICETEWGPGLERQVVRRRPLDRLEDRIPRDDLIEFVLHKRHTRAGHAFGFEWHW
jgi:hypothetical protein